MTGFQRAGQWLDYSGRIGLEIRSPLFDYASVPGILSYPVAFADTPRNRLLLGFPAVRGRQLGPAVAVLDEVDCYLEGVRWRRGTLRYLSYDSAKREYSYQFEADADALASRLQDVTLPALALGTVRVELLAETDDYVLFPVRNNTFYDAEAAPDWCTIVNYFPPGAGVATNTNTGSASDQRYTLTPFLKVLPLLRRALAAYGYELTGELLDDAELQCLVVYATRALDQVASPEALRFFALADVLPDVRLADLLIILQQVFCLAYVFHPVRRQVRLVALRDVAAARPYTARPARADYRELANEADGWLLNFTADGSDELLKDAGWPELRIGNAKETIQPAADTLRMVREADPHQPGRAWLVPAAEQPGQSDREGFEQAENRLGQLRFLFYRGMQPDSNGDLYPLGSAGTVNYQGKTVGKYALAWDGADGLYQQWHKPWLDFRQAARIEERDVALNPGELLLLDPTRKELVEGLKFLWERISLSADARTGLGDATITYHQITL